MLFVGFDIPRRSGDDVIISVVENIATPSKSGACYIGAQGTTYRFHRYYSGLGILDRIHGDELRKRPCGHAKVYVSRFSGATPYMPLCFATTCARFSHFDSSPCMTKTRFGCG